MRIFLVAGMTAVAMSLPPPARAQLAAEQRQCFTGDEVASELRVSACTAIIESGGTSPRNLSAALIRRGNIYFAMLDYDRAFQDYDQAVKATPDSAIAFHNRALVHHRKTRYDRAIEDYDQAVRLDPKYAVAFVNRGNAHRMKGQYDRAIEDCGQAIALNPNLASAFFTRALAYQDRAQWDFDAYLSPGRYENLAIHDYDETIRLNPKNTDALRNRGALYAKARQFDRAIADFDEAIRLDPNLVPAFVARGLALRFAGQYDRAIADYRKALTLKVDDATKRQIELSLKQLGAAP
jgi:tetratricopeptide (TPR) repeat protein